MRTLKLKPAAILKTLILVTLTAVACIDFAQAQHLTLGGGGQAIGTPRRRTLNSSRVWIVDRKTPRLYELLPLLRTGGVPNPVILFGGPGQTTRAAELSHLLQMMPSHEDIWVGTNGVPTGLIADRQITPDEIIENAIGNSVNRPVVYVPESTLLPVAALIAHRMGAVVTTRLPAISSLLIVQVGGTDSVRSSYPNAVFTFLNSKTAALDYANGLADRQALLITEAQHFRPEYLIYAMNRSVKWGEITETIDYVPQNGGQSYFPGLIPLDVQNEFDAQRSAKSQIRPLVKHVFGSATPEALIVGAQWFEIPYRYYPVDDIDVSSICPDCSNYLQRISADNDYANLDEDPWGTQKTSVGRLASYDRDLLSLQVVVGYLSDAGLLEAPATSASYTTFFGDDSYTPIWTQNLKQFQEGSSGRFWEHEGPTSNAEDLTYTLNKEKYFQRIDQMDIVALTGHGQKNSIANSQQVVQINGDAIARTASTAKPAFWLLDACSVGEALEENSQGTNLSTFGNGTIMSGVQARLAFGVWVAPTTIYTFQYKHFWLSRNLVRGKTIGKILQNTINDTVSYYRGEQPQLRLPEGLGGRFDGAPDVKNQQRAWAAHYWLGDPLTLLR
jgi:hypothetical protein